MPKTVKTTALSVLFLCCPPAPDPRVVTQSTWLIVDEGATQTVFERQFGRGSGREDVKVGHVAPTPEQLIAAAAGLAMPDVLG